MKKIIIVGLLVLLVGCHTTPTKQPTSEQEIEKSDDKPPFYKLKDDDASFLLSDILKLFKW